MYIVYSNRYGATGSRLRDALGASRIKVRGNPWRPRRNAPRPSLVVWGGVLERQVPNNVNIIQNGPPINKLEQYRRFAEALPNNHPEFTTDKEQARQWANRGKVLARQTLSGHSGEGIEEFNGQDAPVYVRYYPKDTEVRVQVFDGDVLLITQKRRRNGHPGNSTVRNHHNGYIYSIQLSDWLDVPEIQQLSRIACAACGYRWGGVDILCRRERNPSYIVLECNAAPGLEGRTLNTYAEKFRELCQA